MLSTDQNIQVEFIAYGSTKVPIRNIFLIFSLALLSRYLHLYLYYNHGNNIVFTANVIVKNIFATKIRCKCLHPQSHKPPIVLLKCVNKFITVSSYSIIMTVDRPL